MKDSFLNIDLFEQVFDEKTLRKGLLLFQKLEINLLEKKSGGEFVFGFIGKDEVTLELKKRANKINSFSCSCKNIKCEHLCAAMFFLSDKKIQLNKIKSLRRGFKKDTETIFDEIGVKIKSLKKKYSKQFNENSPGTLRFIEERIEGEEKLTLSLAIINEFSENFSYTKTFNSIEEKNILHFATDDCGKIFKKPLTVFQTETLLICTKKIISNNKKFNSGVFVYLLPYALQHFKTPNQFKEFKILI